MPEPMDTIRRVNSDETMSLEELQRARAVLDSHSRGRKIDVLEARRRVGAMLDELQPAAPATRAPTLGVTGLPISAPPPPKGGGGFLVGVLVVLALLIAGVVYWVSQSTGGDVGGPDGRSDGMAKVMCENFIEDRLKAPSSADFSGMFDTTISGTGSDYTVVGYVDAENSFGAALRSNYTCEVHDNGNDHWSLVSLSGIN